MSWLERSVCRQCKTIISEKVGFHRLSFSPVYTNITQYRQMLLGIFPLFLSTSGVSNYVAALPKPDTVQATLDVLGQSSQKHFVSVRPILRFD